MKTTFNQLTTVATYRNGIITTSDNLTFELPEGLWLIAPSVFTAGTDIKVYAFNGTIFQVDVYKDNSKQVYNFHQLEADARREQRKLKMEEKQQEMQIKKEFNRNSVGWMLFWLWLFIPYGLYRVWRMDMNKVAKVIITIASVAFFMFVLVNGQVQ